VILMTSAVSPQVAVKEGDIAQEDIYYKGAAITYTSQVQTNQLRNQMAGQVEQIYYINAKVTADIIDETQALFAEIDQIKKAADLSDYEKTGELKKLIPGNYSYEVAQYVLTTQKSDFTYLENVLENSIVNVLQIGVLEDDLEQAKEDIKKKIGNIAASEKDAVFLQAVLNKLDIKANKEYDAVATAAEVERLMSSVEPVQVTVDPGEKVLDKGAVITAEQLERLQSLGLQTQSSRAIPFLGIILFVLILYTLLIIYLRIYAPKTRGRESNIVLLCAIINIILLLCRLLYIFGSSDTVELASQVGYLMPVAAASMLLAVLLGRNVSLFVTILLSMAIGIMMGGQFSFTVVALAGGITAVFSTNALNQRGEFVKASLYIVVANSLTILALGLIGNQEFSQVGIGMILGLINGVFAAILTIGLLPFLESVFHVTTVVRMLELSNSNYPLLKRLMMEAPGTYHHSVLVGNLAEAAAQDVQADPLLVRVASYYHDIGKLKRPYFFIENQFSGENPHDKLQPTLSMLIISAHVKNGVEILRKEKFPDEIIDIVKQHHGTSILSYFYHKAKEMSEKPDTIDKNDFRYLGPTPQTKEAAIVMLADSVQAAVQSMDNPSHSQLEKKVKDIIKDKVDQGQLHACHLTFKDMETVAQAFMKVLSGMHHNRIIYPEDVVKEIGGYDHVNMPDDATERADEYLSKVSYDIVGERSFSDSEKSQDSQDV
jgi:putative nucleotidyltransferase with HDIG domain